MLTLLLIIYIIIALSLVLLGALALLKNSIVALNRIFFMFCVALAMWILTNYFSNDRHISEDGALLANHLVLMFAGISMLLMWKFVERVGKVSAIRYGKLLTVISLVTYLSALTPAVVKDIEWQGAVYAIEFGSLANIYFAILGINALLVFVALVKGIRHSHGQDRSRMYTILWSISLWLLISLGTNAVLPALSGSFDLTNLGPLTSVILAAGLAYSIVKHRLFDIRLVVARSLAYVLSIGGLFALYALISSLVLSSIPSERSAHNTSFILVNAAGLAAAVMVYQPLKGFFDKLTNQIFYRDAYDPQVFIDELNKTVISNIELVVLLRQASAVIQDNLRCEQCIFVVFDSKKTPIKVVGTAKQPLDKHDMKILFDKVLAMRSKLILADELDQDATEITRILAKYHLASVAKLHSSVDTAKHPTAYLLLGEKKSGSNYTEQDIRMINIIADELVIAIQNTLRFEEIQNFNLTLQQKVDDATKKLRRTNDKLKELDETKDDFISMASHQLRTPLTSVKGYISMVLEGDAGKVTKDQQKMLEQAFASSQRMVYLISDLLNVSRLKTGKFVIEPSKVNLAALVTQEVDQLVQTAKTKNLKLIYKKPDTFPDAMLDETKIRQVIMNFVDNAIYYTPNDGEIEIALAETSHAIELTVKDSGIGVPKHEQHHLFTKFYRAQNAKHVRPDGTGLGLFMAKKVIVAQGGALIFKSEEGKGSTFGFSFPKNTVSKT